MPFEIEECTTPERVNKAKMEGCLPINDYRAVTLFKD